MRVSVILAHPSGESFCGAIAGVCVDTLRTLGHEVFYHDLYREKFDPVLPWGEVARDARLDPVIKSHCDEISAAGGIVIVHPNWWGQPPAILKGWVDRVLRAGVAYRFDEGDGGEGIPVGLLKARSAMVFNTSNTPSEREVLAFGDPLQTLWQNCIFNLCGVENFYRKMFGVVVTSTPDQRAEWLKAVRETVCRAYGNG